MFIRTMLVAGSLSLVGCAGGDDGSQSTTTSQFPAATAQAEQTNLDETGVAIPDLAPGETPIGPYYDGIYSLEVGECFNLRRTTSGSGIVDFVLRIPCDLGHQNELFAETTYPAESDARYPGEDEVGAWALQYCYRSFETFIGVPYEESVFEVDYDSPTQEYFEDEARSYRGVRCWVSSVGEDLAVGSAGGTNR